MKTYLRIAILGLTIAMGTATDAAARSRTHTYTAKLSTEGASYQGKVDVSGGEVTTIYWPDGSQKDVENGELSNSSAIADIPDFGWVRVEITDPSYKPEEEEYEDDDSNGSASSPE